MGDFYIRMSNNDLVGVHHASCSEYNDFVKNEFAAINFSETIMRFFSIHDQYPFDLPDNEDEWDVIEKIVNSTLGHDAAMTYRQTMDKTHESRDGRTALGLLNFQHIFTEFPVVVARQTEQIILRNEKPAPYGYRWADVVDVTTNSSHSA